MTVGEVEIELHRAIVDTRERYASTVRNLLNAFPTTDYVALLDKHPSVGGYKCRSAPLLAQYRGISSAFPRDVPTYHAIVVLDLIQRSLRKIRDIGLPTEIENICINNFLRIVNYIQAGEIGHMDFPNDRFDKDLSAASMKLVCVGARKVHPVYFPLGLAKRSPHKWAKCAMEVGWRGTLYRMHVDSNDPILLSEFTESGWNRSLHRLAELLKTSSVKGIIGCAWFYDPALSNISPHLAYIRSVIVANGGVGFRHRSSPSAIEAATRTSRTRKRLYEEGRYLPANYTLVWLRKELLAWAGASEQFHRLGG